MSNENTARAYQAGDDPFSFAAAEMRREHIEKHRAGLVKLGVQGADLTCQMEQFIRAFDAEPKQTPATTEASRLADVSDEDFVRAIGGRPETFMPVG